MTKAEVRRRLRDLAALPVEDAALRSREICEEARAHPAWANAAVVAVYAASQHEPALDLLWEKAPTRVFAFPRVEGTGAGEERLAFYAVRHPDELLNSRWGLREPAADPSRLVFAQSIDLVFVPGVAFSPDGARLGRGRGHYDRFLPQLRNDATVIGVCFRERLLPELPVEAHDHRMHAVITA